MSSHVEPWAEYLKSFPKRDGKFVNSLYASGSVPEDMAGALREAILAAPRIRIGEDSMEPGSVFVPHNQGTYDRLNEQHAYRELDETTKKALGEILDCLKAPIASVLNTPWRVLNVRSWTTPPGADFGPNDWHKDAKFMELMKLMIYSTRTGDGYGGIELKTNPPFSVSGPPGAWVLFYNGVLMHRAIAPTVPGAVRVATEVSIGPSVEFDVEPRSLGLIACFPEKP